jgi:DNA-directed RNA polymerase subunit RPC12/RpoP
MTQKGPWITLYQCTKCGEILTVTEGFDEGKIYGPCQQCGNLNWNRKSGRRLYDKVVVPKKYLFGLITLNRTYEIFKGWELYKEY